MEYIASGSDGKTRCKWSTTTEDFIHYHDNEWGNPVKDDVVLFEKICLESFQSGLSWRTILNKRENFRQAFDHFDFYKVALYNEDDIKRLLANEGIVRHKGKIEATINNAQKAIEMVAQEGSLAAYFWSFEPDPKTLASPQSVSTSATAEQLSKALKKKGWKFVGPTTVYAFMQAMGLINDHAEGCFMREIIEDRKTQFKRPTLG